jgi:membrane-bound serine protease (ClpP class)
MWEDIGRLFTEMQLFAAIFLIAGVVLVIAEALEPGIGLAGISGVICLFLGIIIRMSNDGTIVMLVSLLIFISIVIFGALLLLFYTLKRGSRGKGGLINTISSVPFDKTQGTPDYDGLQGVSGVTLTPLRPVGKAKISGHIVDVVAESGFIEQNVNITVILVEGNVVTVKA